MCNKKVVLITGGSGALGSAIVIEFASQGYNVVFTYNNNEYSATELAKKTGAKSLKCNLLNLDEVEKTVDLVIKEIGNIDILVNNAGLTQVMPFALIEEEDWDSIIDSNLKTMFFITKAVIKPMIMNKSGVITNIGSIAGHRLLDVPVHYATAKAAVSGFTLSLAKELSRYNVRVNSIVPGMLTEGVSKYVPDKERKEYFKYCSAGRAGEPTEIAKVVVFISSSASSYINAQNIFVDGGI